MWNATTIDRDTGWQQLTVTPRRTGHGLGHRLLVAFGRFLRWLVTGLAWFVALNALLVATVVPAAGAWLSGHEVWALVLLALTLGAHGAWFAFASESFDRHVLSRVRMWWRRRRYARKWAHIMVAAGLTAKNRARRELAPRVVWVRQGRYADVLRVRLPDGITAARFCERLPEITEALRAREARLLAPPRRRLPRWLAARVSAEFRFTDRRPGTVFLRLAFGDPLTRTILADTVSSADEIDLGALRIGRRDDGRDWLVSLRGTHLLLAGATGSGKGSVLWSLLAALGPAIRDGVVQVVGLDPKGGMELGYGRELFRELVTMHGVDAEEEAVQFLEGLADEADRRAHLLAGHTRLLTPTTSLPFLLVVIDELASITALLSDSKRQRRADAALGRLLTKGRAPGVCVIGALQDPRKDVVRWRDLFPTRIGLRMVDEGQVDMVLGDGARGRGARCDELSESAPGVGYVIEDGSRTVTRVRAAFLTDDDIRHIATTYRPAPAVAGELHPTPGGEHP